MRSTILTVIMSILLTGVIAQQKEQIVIGHIDEIESEILGETRKVWVHVPPGEGEIYLPERYPVVYLLDGPAHFRSVVGMINQMSSVNGNNLCPKMIVVGIPNTDRVRDLTPTKGILEPPMEDSAMIARSGGGENFMAFIEQELIPHVEANYPTLPYRTFIGHSLGGLTAVHALVNHTEVFNAYVAIDPSMSWAQGRLLDEIRSSKIGKKYEGRSFVLGIANTMNAGMDTSMVRTDTSMMSQHIRSIIELHDYMDRNARDHLNYLGRYYPDDTHGSSALITEYDALRFIFKPFQFKWEMRYFMDPEVDIASMMQKHYDELTREYGFELLPSEREVNQMGYQFMRMEQYDKAQGLFKMNVRNYPKSFNVHDSLGDFYATIGEKEKAMNCYEKSLEIRPDSPSKEKLEELKSD